MDKGVQLSLDIESLDRKPSSVVLTVGATFIDVDTGVIVDEGYWRIEREEQLKLGRTIGMETLDFWMGQAYDTRVEAFPGPDVMLTPVWSFILELGHAWERNKCQAAWGNGASFDLGILESLADSFGACMPWDFRQQRCLRTLAKQMPQVPRPKADIPHHAQFDARAQAVYLHRLIRCMNGGMFDHD